MMQVTQETSSVIGTTAGRLCLSCHLVENFVKNVYPRFGDTSLELHYVQVTVDYMYKLYIDLLCVTQW